MRQLNVKTLTLAAALAFLFVTPDKLAAETIRIESKRSVSGSIAQLTSAIKKAGARVFVTVNYQEGAASVGQPIRPTSVIIFGSPKIGAAAFQVSQTIGLYLPLRVLAFEDAEGKVWLIYHDPADAAVEHGIFPDHPAIKAMQGALAKLTKLAAEK
jgi:uncharacterized protein (DUF302 family)